MEAFIGYCVVMLFFWLLLCFFGAKACMQQKEEHLKERERKMTLMKEHPELARDIFLSLNEQDVRWETQQAAKTKAVADSLNKIGDDIRRATAPRPKSHNGAKFAGALLKAGLSIAAKRANNHAK